MIDCVHATETEKKWFSDLDPEHRYKTNFACKCQIIECRCRERIPPQRPPLDAAGLNSHVRYNNDGTKKTDFIIVRSKYCGPKTCSNYERSETNESRRLCDL